ncbi:glycosyltransferase family 2 protein [candidate division TA06 bacterium]|nr:glycosyltransferase family 2 protein [candidate division TA06 bacterium]
MNVDVAIVIVNWCKADLTIKAIESIKYDPNIIVKIIVADNGSNDDSIEKLKRLSNIDLMPLDKNYGYAIGNNIATRYAIKNYNPNYILLLNNDAILSPNTLNLFMKFSETAAILAPKIYYYNSDIIWACGGYVKNKQAMAMNIGQDECDRNQFNIIRDVDFASGCAMWIDTKVIKGIGLLGEKYISYYEDVDYCLRARRSGYSIKYVPDIVVYHHTGATSGGEYNSYQSYFRWRNRLLLNQSNGTQIHKIVFMIILPIIIIRDSFKYVSRGKHRELIEAYKGLLSVIQYGK